MTEPWQLVVMLVVGIPAGAFFLFIAYSLTQDSEND